MHAHGDAPDARPGVQVDAKSMHSVMVGRARKSGEAKGCSQELVGLVEHGLLDDLTRLEEQRLWN